MPDCALCGPVSPGTCAGADRPCVPADRPPLTEAEYARWATRSMQSYADELNDRLAGILPPGMRFEWTAEGQK